MTTTATGLPLRYMTRTVRHKWFLFVAFGAALMVGACLAASNLWAASLASVSIIAIFMMLAGLTQIFQGFTAHGWTGPMLPLAAGLLYFSAGVAAMVDPVSASTLISLGLGVFLCLSAVFKIGYGIRFPQVSGSGWTVASGFMSLLVGGLIVMTWPISGLWLLGIVLAADLAFQGCSYITFGMHIRRSRGFRK